MARARFIRPEFFTDEKVSDLPFGAAMLFSGIWCHSDLRGVFEHNPRLLRGLIFPMRDGIDTGTVGKWLEEMSALGMVVRFEAEGKTWGHVVHWSKHQDINQREVEIGSDRPLPPGWEDPPRWAEIVQKAMVAGRIGERSPWNRSGTVPGPSQDHPGTVLGLNQNNAPTPSPSPSPAVGVSSGAQARVIPPTPAKHSNREALAKCLRRLGLRATEDSMGVPGTITEWADLMQGRGGCRTPEQVLQGIRWIVEQAKTAGVECQYAKHAPALADRWAKMMPPTQGEQK